MITITWLVLLGALSATLLFAVAVVVFSGAPTLPTNRAVATLALVDATFMFNGALFYATDDLAAVRAFQIMIFQGIGLSFLAYLNLLSYFRAGGFSWLHAPPARFVLWMLAIPALALPMAFPDAYIGGWQQPSYAPFEVVFGPAANVTIALYSLVALIGLGSAIAARVRAPTALMRKQANTYVAAFGARDTVMVFSTFIVVSGVWPGETGLMVGTTLAPLLMELLFALLLGYAVLRFQAFDIELRVKLGINRTTLAAIFLAVFFVVGTISSEYLVDRLGFALGGVAAGMLLFAIAPLQRFAERVSNRAMPDVQDTPEYRTRRAKEMYQAAYEGMLVDDHITEKEKDVLAALAQDLGLGPKQVRDIEKAVA